MTLTDIRTLFSRLWRATLTLDDQKANATIAFDTLKPKLPLVSVWAVIGSADGECSLDPKAVGDHGEAFSICQWHAVRANAIKAGCGIDVRTCSFADALKAMEWEMTVGSYRHVWPKLQNATTIWGAVTVLVHDYEQSASQGRDIKRRVALAEKWQAVLPN